MGQDNSSFFVKYEKQIIFGFYYVVAVLLAGVFAGITQLHSTGFAIFIICIGAAFVPLAGNRAFRLSTHTMNAAMKPLRIIWVVLWFLAAVIAAIVRAAVESSVLGNIVMVVGGILIAVILYVSLDKISSANT